MEFGSPSLLCVKHLARDLACGVGGGKARVTAGVVDDFGDLVLGEPVVAGDLDVERQLVGGAQRDEDAERDQAAVAAAQTLTAPESTEDVVDADLEQLVAELAVAEVQLTFGHCARQEFAEDLKSL